MSSVSPEVMDTPDTGMDTGDFNYGIVTFISVLFLILVITLLSFICTRIHLSIRPHTPYPNSNLNRNDHFTLGLDDATLGTYPKLLYSQAKGGSSSSCSICLGDYREKDVLMMLPDCGHLFHQKCVDAWLRLHPTCPICRSSPLPSPMPTPLAEVAPLASAPR